MRNIVSFLRYTGYVNFLNDPISHLLLLILVHVLQPSISFMRTKTSISLDPLQNKGAIAMSKMIKPSSIFTDHYEAMLLLWIHFCYG